MQTGRALLSVPSILFFPTHTWHGAALGQPRGKWMVSLVNSYSNATSRRKHLWEIVLRFAPGLPPGWCGTEGVSLRRYGAEPGGGELDNSLAIHASQKLLSRVPGHVLHCRSVLRLVRFCFPVEILLVVANLTDLSVKGRRHR